MSELLAWTLQKAREQTLSLVADLREDQMCAQSVPGENHPTWILGHLLLSDVYLLSLLEIEELPADFSRLLDRYGPGSIPTGDGGGYDPKTVLTERLIQTGAQRFESVGKKTIADLSRPMTDKILAEVQPTIGHHLQALVFHEGHHCGQLAAWRKGQGLGAMRGAFSAKGF